MARVVELYWPARQQDQLHGLLFAAVARVHGLHDHHQLSDTREHDSHPVYAHTPLVEAQREEQHAKAVENEEKVQQADHENGAGYYYLLYNELVAVLVVADRSVYLSAYTEEELYARLDRYDASGSGRCVYELGAEPVYLLVYERGVPD